MSGFFFCNLPDHLFNSVLFFLFQNRFIINAIQINVLDSPMKTIKNSKYCNDYIKKRITFFMQYCCSKKLKRAIFMSKLIKYMYLCLYICVLLLFLTVNSFNIFKYFFFKYPMHMFILFSMNI